MVKLDDDIPMPRAGVASTRNCRYPLATMGVGQSFAAPVDQSTNIGGRFHSLKPKKFARRTVIENDIKVVRVWRVV